MELSYHEKVQLQQAWWWQPDVKITYLVKVCIADGNLLIRKVSKPL